MGDFNGGCSYVPDNKWDEIRLKTEARFKWLLADDLDTTVAHSDCPYDKYVAHSVVTNRVLIRGSVTIMSRI